MLDITLITVGRLKEPYFQEAAVQYIKRLQPYARLKIIELAVQPFSSGDQEKIKQREGAEILEAISAIKAKASQASIYLLAERGRTFASPELAAWLDKNQPLVFIIAGALGFSPELYGRYPQISLSSLTFPHELARVVFLEQLYRAATILQKKDYHY